MYGFILLVIDIWDNYEYCCHLWEIEEYIFLYDVYLEVELPDYGGGQVCICIALVDRNTQLSKVLISSNIPVSQVEVFPVAPHSYECSTFSLSF